jgi:hypothetical protein
MADPHGGNKAISEQCSATVGVGVRKTGLRRIAALKSAFALSRSPVEQ